MSNMGLTWDVFHQVCCVYMFEPQLVDVVHKYLTFHSKKLLR